MSNPPPMAEIFLSDLRKMVAVARERIRTRKHVPRLAPVAESEDEGAGTTTHNQTQCCWTVTVPNDGKTFATSEVKGIDFEAEFNQEKEEGSMPEQPMELEQALTSNEEGKENSAPPQSLDSSASSGVGISAKEDEKPDNEMPDNEQPNANEETSIESESQTTAKIPRTEEPSEPSRENNEESAEEKGRHSSAATLALATALSTDQKSQQQQQQQPSVVIANNVANNVSRIPTAMTAGGGMNSLNNKPNSLNNKSPRLQLKFTAAALCRRPPPPLPPRPPPQPPMAMATNGSSNGDSAAAAEKPTATTTTAVEQKQHIPPSSTIAMMKRKKVEDMNIICGEDASAEKSKVPPSAAVPHSYAICPPSGYALDRMKKSLPRRKKVVHQPIEKPTTTIVASSSAQKTADSAAAATVSVL